MVNAGLVPATVVDDYLARVLEAGVHESSCTAEAALRTGGEFALAIRKNSPLLKAELDAFLARVPAGLVDAATSSCTST